MKRDFLSLGQIFVGGIMLIGVIMEVHTGESVFLMLIASCSFVEWILERKKNKGERL